MSTPLADSATTPHRSMWARPYIRLADRTDRRADERGVGAVLDIAALPKVSADAHVNEPHDLWVTRLPEGLRAAAPQRIQSQEDGGWRLAVNGEVEESGDRLPVSEASAKSLAVAEAEENRQREADASVGARWR